MSDLKSIYDNHNYSLFSFSRAILVVLLMAGRMCRGGRVGVVREVLLIGIIVMVSQLTQSDYDHLPKLPEHLNIFTPYA